jgi:hypothetical protein
MLSSFLILSCESKKGKRFGLFPCVYPVRTRTQPQICSVYCRSCCDKLGQVADRVIQELTDPLILQPASLDVATIRKRTEEEIGK